MRPSVRRVLRDVRDARIHTRARVRPGVLARARDFDLVRDGGPRGAFGEATLRAVRIKYIRIYKKNERRERCAAVHATSIKRTESAPQKKTSAPTRKKKKEKRKKKR